MIIDVNFGNIYLILNWQKKKVHCKTDASPYSVVVRAKCCYAPTIPSKSLGSVLLGGDAGPSY